MFEKLYIIKIGGNIIDDPSRLTAFLEELAGLPGKKILVHGGGKLATRVAEGMGIQQQMVDGRRITDAETLKIVTMVYAGYINKNIVAQLQQFGCNAMGVTGADANCILAHKRVDPAIDYGFAGDVDVVNTAAFHVWLNQVNLVVVAPITHDQKGQLLNTNADTMAQEIATAMSRLYDTSLIFSFEKAGVLLDAEDETTVIPVITPAYYETLKAEQKVFAGMIPKLDNAFAAVSKGVSRVIIGKAEQLNLLTRSMAGTTIQSA